MDKKYRFTSEVTADPPLFQECLQLNIDTYGRNAIFCLIQLCMLLFCFINFSDRLFRIFILVFAAITIITEWNQRKKIKNGGIYYKQLLFQNAGKTPHQILCFDEDQLITRNIDTDSENITQYSQYVRLCESKNLIVLFLDINMYKIIDKRTLTDGTSQELIAFLRSKCPNLKKRVLTGRLIRYLRYLVWISLAAGILAVVLTHLEIPQKLSGRLTNEMSYQEMAKELAPLGIVISPDTVKNLKEYENHADGSIFYEDNSKVLSLLCTEGMGEYDYDTWEWTPSESGVYWFDMEVMNASSIYTDFLRGLDAMDPELRFSNIEEDYSNVDMESGMGFVTLSFQYTGYDYIFQPKYEYDWFDFDILSHIGCILNSDSEPQNLWYAIDGQGILLYYGTEEQVKILTKKTGISFMDAVALPQH